LMNNPLAGTDPTGYAATCGSHIPGNSAPFCSTIDMGGSPRKENNVVTIGKDKFKVSTGDGPKTYTKVTRDNNGAKQTTDTKTETQTTPSKVGDRKLDPANEPVLNKVARAVDSILTAAFGVAGDVAVSTAEDAVKTAEKAVEAGDALRKGDYLEAGKKYVAAVGSGVLALAVSEIKGAGRVAGLAGVPGRVQSRINLSNLGMEHVIDRHFSGKANASQFSLTVVELRTILSSRDAVGSPVIRSIESENGILYLRQFDAGQIVGTDRFNGNQATSVMTIMSDKFGNLVTTFPGKLK
jgi:hypothetical protein